MHMSEVIDFTMAKWALFCKRVRDEPIPQSPEEKCAEFFGSDTLLLCEDKSLIPSERRRILGDKELMRLYREAHSVPEERSQKPQKDQAPSEPDPEPRLIPFPSKRHERDSSTS